MEEKLKEISQQLAAIYGTRGQAEAHEVIEPILDTLSSMLTALWNYENRIKALEDKLNPHPNDGFVTLD